MTERLTRYEFDAYYSTIIDELKNSPLPRGAWTIRQLDNLQAFNEQAEHEQEKAKKREPEGRDGENRQRACFAQKTQYT